jgi:hypothetical protein
MTLTNNLIFMRLPYLPHWSPPAPEGGEVTIEGDELYTRVGENLPPRSLAGLDH